jgi:hypothetical protein
MMNRYLFAALLSAAALYGQDGTLDKVTVPLSDPSRPAQVNVSLVDGSIHVTGYEGKTVVVETRGAPLRNRRLAMSPGMKVEEQNNTVRVKTGFPGGAVRVNIQVPRNTR